MVGLALSLLLGLTEIFGSAEVVMLVLFLAMVAIGGTMESPKPEESNENPADKRPQD